MKHQPDQYSYDPDFHDAYHHVPAYRYVYPDENVIRFLAASFPGDRTKKKILDLGCGCGRHMVLLCKFGFQSYGLDGSSFAVQYTKDLLKDQRLSADIRLGRITQLPYVGETFDGIIEHATLVNNSWEDILKALEEAHRVLKKGGMGFFLLKRIEDCAFLKKKKVGPNDYLIEESVYLSKTVRKDKKPLLFHAFSKKDLKLMFKDFSRVRVHTWDTSFKALDMDEIPGRRRTAYWIVLAQK